MNAQDKKVIDGVEYIPKESVIALLKDELKVVSNYYEKTKNVARAIGNTDAWGRVEACEQIIKKIEAL